MPRYVRPSFVVVRSDGRAKPFGAGPSTRSGELSATFSVRSNGEVLPLLDVDAIASSDGATVLYRVVDKRTGTLTQTLGSAKIHASIYQQDMGEEFPGECEWTLSVEHLRRIFARFPKLEYSGMISEGIGNALENCESGAEEFDDMLPEESVSFRDADSGILLLRAMAEIGGEWHVDWNGENETWFFHDWDHAENDCWISNDVPEIRVDADAEHRALANGAHAALMAGIDLATVCEVLATSMEPFRERFGYKPDDLFARVFHGPFKTEAAALRNAREES